MAPTSRLVGPLGSQDRPWIGRRDRDVARVPGAQSKLARLAAERGRDPEALAREAIERFVDYDEWFVKEVEKGLAQIARGEVLTHEEVGARLEKSLTERQTRE